jgi:hypothetical protein
LDLSLSARSGPGHHPGLPGRLPPEPFLFDAAHRLVYRGQLDGSRPGDNLPCDGRDLRAVLLVGEQLPSEHRPSIGCNIKWHPGQDPSWRSWDLGLHAWLG